MYKNQNRFLFTRNEGGQEVALDLKKPDFFISPSKDTHRGLAETPVSTLYFTVTLSLGRPLQLEVLTGVGTISVTNRHNFFNFANYTVV